MIIRTYLVEDEAPALQRLEDLLAGMTEVRVIGSTPSGKQAVMDIDTLKPDLLFLDIQLRDLSGIDVLHLIQHQPAVIFTTAYDQYAIQAFELRAVDYLLKPFSGERLQEALLRAREKLLAPIAPEKTIKQLLTRWQPPATYLRRVASKVGDKIFIFSDEEVVYFASENKLIFAYLEDRKFLINYTLAQLQARLDPEKFFRIHRSTIVNLNYVHKIEIWFGGGYKLTVRDKQRSELTISRTAGKALRNKLGW
ncbi:MAG: LytR/AlgR family response regulator transcription factor [bacterium]